MPSTTTSTLSLHDALPICDVGIVVAALERDVEAFDRAALGEVERLALGDALDDVEQDDVAELLRRGEMGEGAADIAGTDERDLDRKSTRLNSSHLVISYAVHYDLHSFPTRRSSDLRCRHSRCCP